MEIKVGQIWKRINPMHNNEMYFPKRGWKVQITTVGDGLVSHKIVEYDGYRRSDTLSTSHFVDDFLSMYELEEE